MPPDTPFVPGRPLECLPARQARIGIDAVRISAIEGSIADFGARFTSRIYAPGELHDATVDGRLDAGALAARFAAKEAAIKAFGLSEAGVAWSQIEVGPAARDPSARRMVLTGRAAESVSACGPYEIAVALSHREDMACAVVVALPAEATPEAAGRTNTFGGKPDGRERHDRCPDPGGAGAARPAGPGR